MGPTRRRWNGMPAWLGRAAGVLCLAALAATAGCQTIRIESPFEESESMFHHIMPGFGYGEGYGAAGYQPPPRD